MELAIAPAAKALDIVGVGNPVAGPDVTFQSHIVDVLVDVKAVAYLLVEFRSLLGRELKGKVHEFQPCLVVTNLLVVLRVAKVKLVHVLCVYAIIAISIVLVVAFAYVEHSHILAVEEDMGRLIVLTVDVEATLHHDLLQCRVDDTSIGVVASVAHLPAAILVVWLVGKDRTIDGVDTLVPLVCLDTEGGFHLPVLTVHHSASVRASPSSGYLHVYLLVHLRNVRNITILVLLRDKIFEVDGTLPVHVPVAGRALPIARNSIRTSGIYSYGIVVKVLGVGRNGDDRQVIVVVPVYIAARDHRTWQIAVCNEAETKDCSLCDIEPACRTRRAVGGRWSASIRSILQQRASRYGDPHGKRVGEDMTVHINLRRVKPLDGKLAAFVACIGRWSGSNAPFVCSIC